MLQNVSFSNQTCSAVWCYQFIEQIETTLSKHSYSHYISCFIVTLPGCVVSNTLLQLLFCVLLCHNDNAM